MSDILNNMVLEQDRSTRQVNNKRPLYTEQEEEMVDSDDSGAALCNTSKYVAILDTNKADSVITGRILTQLKGRKGR